MVSRQCTVSLWHLPLFVQLKSNQVRNSINSALAAVIPKIYFSQQHDQSMKLVFQLVATVVIICTGSEPEGKYTPALFTSGIL